MISQSLIGHSSQIHQIHIKWKILTSLKYSPFDSHTDNKKLQKSLAGYPSGSDFMAILRIFPAEFADKMWFGAFSGYPLRSENLNKNIGFGGMWTLPGPLSEKLNFTFVINSKTDFSGGWESKKLHFDANFHIFRSTWESNKFKTCF